MDAAIKEAFKEYRPMSWVEYVDGVRLRYTLFLAEHA
jgi:hypothetical protein